MKERALVDRTIGKRMSGRSPTTSLRVTERAQATERDVALLEEILARL